MNNLTYDNVVGYDKDSAMCEIIARSYHLPGVIDRVSIEVLEGEAIQYGINVIAIKHGFALTKDYVENKAKVKKSIQTFLLNHHLTSHP